MDPFAVRGPGPMRVGFVAKAFPQLSETFVENERRALVALGADLTVISIYRPPDDLRGPTELADAEISYPPGAWALAIAAARWAVRRPLAMASNLVWAT